MIALLVSYILLFYLSSFLSFFLQFLLIYPCRIIFSQLFVICFPCLVQICFPFFFIVKLFIFFPFVFSWTVFSSLVSPSFDVLICVISLFYLYLLNFPFLFYVSLHILCLISFLLSDVAVCRVCCLFYSFFHLFYYLFNFISSFTSVSSYICFFLIIFFPLTQVCRYSLVSQTVLRFLSLSQVFYCNSSFLAFLRLLHTYIFMASFFTPLTWLFVACHLHFSEIYALLSWLLYSAVLALHCEHFPGPEKRISKFPAVYLLIMV